MPLADVRFPTVANIRGFSNGGPVAYDPPRHGPKLLGWAVLLLGLPLAFIAAVNPPNEYEAIFGINALDCDGPMGTYIFAVPALIIYGTALGVQGAQWRKRTKLIVAIVCFVICASVIANVVRAAIEEREQEAACRSR